MIWGRTHTSWDKTLIERFGLKNKNQMYRIFDNKTFLVLQCCKSWPRFVTFDEDKNLRKKKWGEKYGNKRIIMWDGTDIPFLYKPSTALNQRITY
jgi:hypothetical protein